ncbi:MAG: ribosome small subunit-dependent GTPase A [Candidatus Saccharibacteria bacterium]
MMNLETYGWNDSFAAAFKELGLADCVPGRVIADYGSYLKIAVPEETVAEIAGTLQHISEPYQLPKVGDWVALQLVDQGRAVVRAVLPRLSEINRKAAGTGNGRQVLATNVDTAFVVQALDFDFNPSRLERYTYQLRQSHIEPIFIFNKADKASDLPVKLATVESLKVPFIITTATLGEGIGQVRAAMTKGKTAVFLGSSGVGKSTLTNALLGDDRQKTAAVRESDSMGRHTTSHREIFVLPGGGLIIDTPGIRELQLWGEEEYLSSSFTDIEALADQCEFRNCSHTKELNCAVLREIERGTLPEARLESYLKLKNELQVNAFVAASLSAKQKKQRARRLRKATQLDEKLDSDAEIY